MAWVDGDLGVGVVIEFVWEVVACDFCAEVEYAECFGDSCSDLDHGFLGLLPSFSYPLWCADDGVAGDVVVAGDGALPAVDAGIGAQESVAGVGGELPVARKLAGAGQTALDDGEVACGCCGFKLCCEAFCDLPVPAA